MTQKKNYCDKDGNCTFLWTFDCNIYQCIGHFFDAVNIFGCLQYKNGRCTSIRAIKDAGAEMTQKKTKFANEFIPLIKDGTKTLTRRPMNPQPDKFDMRQEFREELITYCPYGKVGEHLLVDFEPAPKIVSIRVEKLQSIKVRDLEKEGVLPTGEDLSDAVRKVAGANRFRNLWNTFYPKLKNEKVETLDSWEDNPMVWVIEFEVV